MAETTERNMPETGHGRMRCRSRRATSRVRRSRCYEPTPADEVTAEAEEAAAQINAGKPGAAGRSGHIARSRPRLHAATKSPMDVITWVNRR